MGVETIGRPSDPEGRKRAKPIQPPPIETYSQSQAPTAPGTKKGRKRKEVKLRFWIWRVLGEKESSPTEMASDNLHLP